MVLPCDVLALTEGIMQHLLCRLMMHPHTALKPAVFSYQEAGDAFVPGAGPAQRGMKDCRGRRNDAGAREKLRAEMEGRMAHSGDRRDLTVFSY